MINKIKKIELKGEDLEVTIEGMTDLPLFKIDYIKDKNHLLKTIKLIVTQRRNKANFITNTNLKLQDFKTLEGEYV